MNDTNIPHLNLYIKPELFDHLIYPISTKLDDNTIIVLFRKLRIFNEQDFKISLKEWTQRAIEIGLTENESKVLFQTYKIFDSDNPEYLSNVNSRYESSSNKDTVNASYFGLYFVLQTYLQRTKISLNIEKNDKSPSTYLNSPLTSPRSKNVNTFRNQNQEHEYHYMVNFIKTNLKLFLRIISSDIHNSETNISQNEFNTLRFLFKLDGEISNTDKQKKPLSTYTNFFENKIPGINKINMNIINDYLQNTISNDPPLDSDYIQIKNLSKCVTIKTSSDIQNKNIKITQCEDSYIYINTYIVNCKISYCTNCTIVIAVASKIISIDKCEKCQISIISNLTRISNAIDTNVYMYSVSEPILFGDNRGLSLGPHNVTYNDLYSFIRSSKILLSHQGIKNFSIPINLNPKNDINIISPEHFNTIVVPFDKNSIGYKLTPKIYIEAIEKKYETYNKIKNMIKNSGLSEEEEKNFHRAIQGYFREWLVTSGNFKTMNNIVKMIDSPFFNFK